MDRPTTHRKSNSNMETKMEPYITAGTDRSKAALGGGVWPLLGADRVGG